MAEYVSHHLLLRGFPVAGVVATSLFLGGCTAGTDTTPMPNRSGSPNASSTPAVAQTPSSADASGADTDAAVESCVATLAWPDYAITVGDTAASQVTQRTVDDLLFVTVPAQSEAVSSSGALQIDGSIYCYLDPTTLEPLRRAVGDTHLIAHGFQVSLIGEEYEKFLSAPDPIAFIYPD